MTASDYRRPAMLMIAECSAQVRQWETAVLAADPAIQRTQYMLGVGHHMWNGLDDNNQRAAAVITAFLDDRPAPPPQLPHRRRHPHLPARPAMTATARNEHPLSAADSALRIGKAPHSIGSWPRS
jgi:hypothetical protein